MNKHYNLINRLKDGKPFSEKFQPYSKIELNECLDYLIDVEDYENCAYLRDYIKSRFNHKINYLL
jgi:protein-arginine kinase activator protein McsA